MCGMDKNLINMKSIDNITRKMLSVIRENNNISSQGIIKEDVDKTNSKLDGKKGLPIKKNRPQFGDVREAQEQSLIKTLGENIEFEENALMYYPENKDLVLTGKINALNLAFQFRYNDPSGDGCYIWANALQLTETNNRTIGKVRDAFVNWKNSLIQDGDLIARLQKTATEQ